MGFTHYWEVLEPVRPSVFRRFCDVAKEICKDVPLQASATRLRVEFEDAEWFDLSNTSPPKFEYCKTARGPDDPYVFALLDYAKHLYKHGIDASCDGGPEAESVARGAELLKAALRQVSARRIQRAWSNYLAKRTIAARVIQKHWKEAAYNPERTLCVSRLTKIFSECPFIY
jgi:hypothetical protein